MSRALLTAAAIVGLSVLSRPAAGDEPKTADEVIAKHIAAMGGREKIDAIKTMRSTGKAAFGGDKEAPLTLEVKRPNKFRVEFTLQGMTTTQAYDGTTGWFILPFMGKTDPQKMTPDQVKIMDEQADFDGPLVDYAKKGHKVELVGKEDAAGASAYKLKVTKKGGGVEHHFIDAEKFLLQKIERKQDYQAAQVDAQIMFGDYKIVAGVQYAHSVRQKAGQMGESTWVFEKVEANVPIDDERFQMPKPKPADSGKPEEKAKPTEDKKP